MTKIDLSSTNDEAAGVKRQTRRKFFGLVGAAALVCVGGLINASCENGASGSAAAPSGDASSRLGGTARTISSNGVEFRFRWIPAGSFMMGSPENEQYRRDDEKQHKVTLTRGFWMLETPVTQRMWTSIAGENPSYFGFANFKLLRMFYNTSNLPVESVSWTDVTEDFMPKLNAAFNGMTFRLPTEAEWEYAARACEAYQFPGSDVPEDAAWFGGDLEIGGTHRVGAKKANAWGLKDMGGNVWEWLADWYDGRYYDAEDAVDPIGPDDGKCRVVRGGAWDIDWSYCRCAHRYCLEPDSKRRDVGFRVVMTDDRE